MTMQLHGAYNDKRLEEEVQEVLFKILPLTVASEFKVVNNNTCFECEFGNASDCTLAMEILRTILTDTETEVKATKGIFQRLFDVIRCRSSALNEIRPRALFPTTINKRKEKQNRKSNEYESKVHKQICDALSEFDAFRRKNHGFGKKKKPDEVRTAKGFTQT